jgi:hypothetical protein
MFAYIDADDTVYYYDGSGWEAFGAVVDSDQNILATQVFS